MMMLSFLAGCSESVTAPPIEITPLERPQLVLPQTSTLKLREVQWSVVNESNVQSVFDDLKNQGTPVVLFSLTDRGYENLSLNINDLRSLIEEQQSIILAYQNYYVVTDSMIENHNSKLND